MARIGHKADVKGLSATLRLIIGGEANVIFDISAASVGMRSIVIHKAGKNIHRRLAHGIDKDIESPTMCHTKNGLLNPGMCHEIEKIMEGGNEGLPSLKGKALLAYKIGMNEAFKLLRTNEVLLKSNFLFLLQPLCAFLPSSLVISQLRTALF